MARRVRQGNLRATIKLLRTAATPEVYLRAFKTLKQGTPAGATLGIVATNTTQYDRWWGIAIGVFGPLWAGIQSFWDNTVDNAQKIINDAPTTKDKGEA